MIVYCLSVVWMGEHSSCWGEIRDYLAWTVSTPRTETSVGKLADLWNIPFFTPLLFFLCHFNITLPTIYLGCTLISWDVFNLLLCIGKDLFLCSLRAQGDVFKQFHYSQLRDFCQHSCFLCSYKHLETLHTAVKVIRKRCFMPINKAVIYGFPLIKYC